jgi:hypothetical protein
MSTYSIMWVGTSIGKIGMRTARPCVSIGTCTDTYVHMVERYKYRLPIRVPTIMIRVYLSALLTPWVHFIQSVFSVLSLFQFFVKFRTFALLKIVEKRYAHMFRAIRLRYAVNIRVIWSCFYIYVLLDSVHFDKNSEFLIFWDWLLEILKDVRIIILIFGFLRYLAETLMTIVLWNCNNSN